MEHHLRCFIYLTNPKEISQVRLVKFSLTTSNQFIFKIYIQSHILKQWFLCTDPSVFHIKIKFQTAANVYICLLIQGEINEMTILDEQQQITENVKTVMRKVIKLCDRRQVVKLKGRVFIY